MFIISDDVAASRDEDENLKDGPVALGDDVLSEIQRINAAITNKHGEGKLKVTFTYKFSPLAGCDATHTNLLLLNVSSTFVSS